MMLLFHRIFYGTFSCHHNTESMYDTEDTDNIVCKHFQWKPIIWMNSWCGFYIKVYKGDFLEVMQYCITVCHSLPWMKAITCYLLLQILPSFKALWCVMKCNNNFRSQLPTKGLYVCNKIAKITKGLLGILTNTTKWFNIIIWLSQRYDQGDI